MKEVRPICGNCNRCMNVNEEAHEVRCNNCNYEVFSVISKNWSWICKVCLSPYYIISVDGYYEEFLCSNTNCARYNIKQYKNEYHIFYDEDKILKIRINYFSDRYDILAIDYIENNMNKEIRNEFINRLITKLEREINERDSS